MVDVAEREVGEEQVDSIESGREEARRRLRGIFDGYEGGEEMPLGGYAAILGLFTLAAGATAAAARWTGVRLPRRVGFRDILLLGIGTHKLSRLVTKDWVTSPIRAAFVTYGGSAGAGEVKESSRGQGLRRAVGDLVTCPWCSGAWIAGAFGAGFAFAPRLARFAAGVLAIETVSDWLHLGYDAARRSK